MPKIGIFWIYANQVVGRALPLDAGFNSDGWIDSPDQHVTVWESEPAFTLLRLNGVGYESIPRGRVVWSSEKEKSVVYLNKTLLHSEPTRKMLTDFFNLSVKHTEWKSDPHYTTDPDELDRMFND